MKRLRRHGGPGRFYRDITAHTPFVRMLLSLTVLWIVFAGGIYLAESGAPGSSIHSLGDALYWGVAAFSTAGIAGAPVTGMAKLIGGLWIVVGSVLFFGTIVATVTTYFSRPMQRPHRKIIDVVEFNLEQLDDLNVDELDLLKETVDSLIEHVERIRTAQQR